MPYKVKKVNGGFKVASKDTGKTHSKHPMSKEMAMRQMRAMYANMSPDDMEKIINKKVKKG